MARCAETTGVDRKYSLFWKHGKSGKQLQLSADDDRRLVSSKENEEKNSRAPQIRLLLFLFPPFLFPTFLLLLLFRLLNGFGKKKACFQ